MDIGRLMVNALGSRIRGRRGYKIIDGIKMDGNYQRTKRAEEEDRQRMWRNTREDLPCNAYATRRFRLFPHTSGICLEILHSLTLLIIGYRSILRLSVDKLFYTHIIRCTIVLRNIVNLTRYRRRSDLWYFSSFLLSPLSCMVFVSTFSNLELHPTIK